MKISSSTSSSPTVTDLQTQTEESERAKREGEKRLDEIKDQYEKLAIKQEAKNLEQIENQRSRGYEHLRNLQRDQQSEAKRIKREGEKEQSDLNQNFMIAKEKLRIDSDKERKLKERELQVEFDRQTREKEQRGKMSELQTQAEMKTLQERHKDQMSRALHEHQKEEETFKTQTRDSKANMAAKWMVDHDSLLKSQQEILKQTYQDTQSKIENIQHDLKTKLSAYSAREGDPFYQITVPDAALGEESNALVLVAKIPKHEQDGIQVQIRGNELVLSGKRSSSDSIKLAEGETASTHSYQSFERVFPIDANLDVRQLSKRFDGDHLIVEIPKKRLKEMVTYQKPVTKAELKKPHFPEGIGVMGPTKKSDPPIG